MRILRIKSATLAKASIYDDLAVPESAGKGEAGRGGLPRMTAFLKC